MLDAGQYGGDDSFAPHPLVVPSASRASMRRVDQRPGSRKYWWSTRSSDCIDQNLQQGRRGGGGGCVDVAVDEDDDDVDHFGGDAVAAATRGGGEDCFLGVWGVWRADGRAYESCVEPAAISALFNRADVWAAALTVWWR
jgi:hypothetical protein